VHPILKVILPRGEKSKLTPVVADPAALKGVVEQKSPGSHIKRREGE